jgi:hypothetical protein
MENYEIEYEVITDANIIGEVEYEPFAFRVWDIGIRTPGEKRLLCLRNVSKSKESKTLLRNAHDFVYLASLFLRRRLSLGYMTRYNNAPARFSVGVGNEKGYLDKDIVMGESNVNEILQWLLLIEKLGESRYDKFILASRFYSQALEYMETVPDMAYLNLVSSVEILSQDMDIGPISVEEINAHMASLFSEIKENELKEKIEDAFLKNERFIKRRFIEFVLKYTNEDFWNYDNRPEIGKIEQNELKKYLSNVYDQRSKTLHDGEPFPIYIFQKSELPNIGNIPFNTPLTIRSVPMDEVPRNVISYSEYGRKWEYKDFIPYPHFFERLINHVLRNYLKENVK